MSLAQVDALQHFTTFRTELREGSDFAAPD